MAQHIGPVFGFISVLIAIGFLTLYGEGRQGRRADVAMIYGLMGWMVFDNLADRTFDIREDSLYKFVEFMSYQICLAAASLLVLVGAALPSVSIWRAVGFQTLGGVGALAAWTWTGEAAWFAAWHWFNLFFVVGVMAQLMGQLRSRRNARTLARFALSSLLLFCGMAGAWPLAFAPWLVPTGIHVFPAVLVSAWWMLSDRRGRLNAMAAGSDLRGSGGGDNETRQRIAQDVHDGVGSHLAAILSSLDLRDSSQKDLALSLEQCLLDLKIMVDHLHDGENHPVEALAMLRYRVQPCLDRMGVRVVWDVEEHPAMERLDGSTVMQLLKIAQEAFANVMRHANATEVRLSFLYDEASQIVQLSIADNGRGFDSGQKTMARRGKGLTGMLQRAKDMGATMTVDSAPGQGTRIQVSV